MLETIFSNANLLNLLILFILTFISSFGVPGALFWMISIGALANSYQDLFPIIIVAIIAAILGDICAYLLARRFSIALKPRLLRFKFYRKGEVRITDFFTKSEFLLVFLTRFFVTGLCAPVNYISGFEKLNYKKFVAAVVSGEILYGSIYPILGFIFKQTWNDLTSFISDIGIIAMLVLLMAIIIAVFVIDKNNKKKHESDN